MPATEKELLQVEEWIVAGPVKKTWFIAPFPIPPLKNKRKEFVKAVVDSRVRLIHDDWGECCEDARLLSETGGIHRVIVASVTTAKTTMAAEFQNGRNIHKGER